MHNIVERCETRNEWWLNWEDEYGETFPAEDWRDSYFLNLNNDRYSKDGCSQSSTSGLSGASSKPIHDHTRKVPMSIRGHKFGHVVCT